MTTATQIAADKKRELWNALYDFVHGNGGWVVSVPDAFPLRVELRQGSALPAKLTQAGYAPRSCGMTTRILPNKPIVSVDIIEIDLPGH